MNSVMYSSKKDDWETPQDLFDALNKKYNFDLDPAATVENAKCKEFFTKKENGLLQNWGGEMCVLQSTIYIKRQKLSL